MFRPGDDVLDGSLEFGRGDMPAFFDPRHRSLPNLHSVLRRAGVTRADHQAFSFAFCATPDAQIETDAAPDFTSANTENGNR
jgi:hypothetical protein